MNGLFNDILEGFKKQGFEDVGGNDTTYHLLRKDDKILKVFATDYDNPTEFIVRYSSWGEVI